MTKIIVIKEHAKTIKGVYSDTKTSLFFPPTTLQLKTYRLPYKLELAKILILIITILLLNMARHQRRQKTETNNNTTTWWRDHAGR